MKTFLEQYEDSDQDDELMEYYHQLVSELIDKLSASLDLLSDDVADLVFEINDIAVELSYDDDEYEYDYESSVAGDVGDYKPPLKKQMSVRFESELDEVAAKKKKRDKLARLKRRREYRKNRSKIKSSAKRLRKTSKYKKYQKKAKRLGKRGLTTTGKRKISYI